MNKSGNLLDWFLILAVLFVIGITILASYIMVNVVDTSNIFSETPEAQTAIDTTKSTLLGFDSMMLFVIVGLSLYVLVSSAVVYNHPAFFIVGIILLFIAITVAGVISNTFWIFTSDDGISATAALFPKLTFLMGNLPFYVLFMGMVAAIVMYIGSQRQ